MGTIEMDGDARAPAPPIQLGVPLIGKSEPCAEVGEAMVA